MEPSTDGDGIAAAGRDPGDAATRRRRGKNAAAHRRSRALAAVQHPVVYDKHGNSVAQYDGRGRLSANWVRLQNSHAIQREAATMVLLSSVCSCAP